MNKDIEFPEVRNVAVAIVPDGEDVKSPWKVYLLNLGEKDITNVMVTSTGFGASAEESQQTSTLRFSYDKIFARTKQAIELIDPAVFHLNNEYWISFWEGDKLFDKRYLFVPESIHESHFTNIPMLNMRGILHE